MRTKPCIEKIPALYRSSHEDTSMYYWVLGQRRIFPTMTVEQSIGMWIEYVGGDWDIVSLSTTFFRMQKKDYDSQKL